MKKGFKNTKHVQLPRFAEVKMNQWLEHFTSSQIRKMFQDGTAKQLRGCGKKVFAYWQSRFCK